MPTYIIEHLEGRLWKWCLIEYKHLSAIVKKNVWFTNVKKAGVLRNYGRVMPHSVTELHLKNACILDPDAPQTLTPAEAKSFDYFIFGGILGDDPPQKRTFPELTSKLPGVAIRNLGTAQMSTDTAVYVVKQIVGGKRISDLKFKDEVEIKLGRNESTILPYRYVLKNGKPLISKELVAYLQKKKGF